jgi:hypothetical protein
LGASNYCPDRPSGASDRDIWFVNHLGKSNRQRSSLDSRLDLHIQSIIPRVHHDNSSTLTEPLPRNHRDESVKSELRRILGNS